MSETLNHDPQIAATRARLRQVIDQYYRIEAELRDLEDSQFRVCIFGSARIQPEDEIYQVVRRLACSLAQLGIDIVTGGGPGLMEAANLGVREAHNERSLSIGLPIDLPSVRELANKHLDIKSEHRRFSSRLDEFMRLSHAVIVAPGGIGTLLELVYVWQLIQVAHIERRTIVLLQSSYWSGLLDWMRDEMLGRGLVAERDFEWVRAVDTPAEAFDLIRLELDRFMERQRRLPDGEAPIAQAEQIAAALDAVRQQPEQQEPLPHLAAGED